jgi:hypothetical protein
MGDPIIRVEELIVAYDLKDLFEGITPLLEAGLEVTIVDAAIREPRHHQDFPTIRVKGRASVVIPVMKSMGYDEEDLYGSTE